MKSPLATIYSVSESSIDWLNFLNLIFDWLIWSFIGWILVTFCYEHTEAGCNLVFAAHYEYRFLGGMFKISKAQVLIAILLCCWLSFNKDSNSIKLLFYFIFWEGEQERTALVLCQAKGAIQAKALKTVCSDLEGVWGVL